jgi:hypothetical protein
MLNSPSTNRDNSFSRFFCGTSPTLAAGLFQGPDGSVLPAGPQADQQGGVAPAQEAARAGKKDHRQVELFEGARGSIHILVLDDGEHQKVDRLGHG